MRDFRSSPAATEKDLGIPLPDSPHACSVCLPSWSSIVGYEEGRGRVINRLRAGYPRFFRNPLLARLTLRAEEELKVDGEHAVLFPTKGAAQKAQRWIERRARVAARSSDFEGLQVVIVPESAVETARLYQRYSGEIVSSRMAEDLLNGGLQTGSKSHLLRRRLASIYGANPAGVQVFANGMAAVTGVMRSLPGIAEGKKTLQLEFPYVDSLKVQEQFGNGVVFLNEAEGESFEEALRRIEQGEFAAVFTEVPSNPLLRTLDLPAVSAACREGGVPLIVDDSSVGPFNVKALPWADAVTCSLTKWLSGVGDVMGGAVIIREDSPFADELGASLARESEETNPLYIGDSQVLLSNLKGYSTRMEAPNENALQLVELLTHHPSVDRVWHPSVVNRSKYEVIQSPGGGYGGLLSFTLKNSRRTSKVYDALGLSKGPSFGTTFSLVSPYVMLAHYEELDWAEGCGVPAHLIRVSCGNEDPTVLQTAFSDALDLG
ncbi:PLP-dependent transferase [Haloferula rosea]|uniref:PLP-dependent transferase n=1 Tax=Haloferula rosea TaxID=490093 RepID=A0A934VD77_9BACT|nr:PLP-dependent transferase [Haloferula rosea]MBK1826009.1 PLP-dependent transferase [Haloferula rosea]